MDPDLAARDLGVVVVVDVHVGQVGQVLEGLPGRRDLVRVRGVEIEVAVLHQPEADRLPRVVEYRDPVLVLGLPGHRPRIRHRVRVLVDVVLTPGDAGRVDRVGHRVLPLAVVEGVGEVRPRLRDVRDVAVVERLDQLPVHQLRHDVDGREEHVEVELPAAQFGQRGVHVLERGHLDLAVVLLTEGFQAVGVDVGDPVEQSQRGVLLGSKPALDRQVVLGQGPGHRVVRPGKRDPAGCVRAGRRGSA